LTCVTDLAPVSTQLPFFDLPPTANAIGYFPIVDNCSSEREESAKGNSTTFLPANFAPEHLRFFHINPRANAEMASNFELCRSYVTMLGEDISPGELPDPTTHPFAHQQKGVVHKIVLKHFSGENLERNSLRGILPILEAFPKESLLESFHRAMQKHRTTIFARQILQAITPIFESRLRYSKTPPPAKGLMIPGIAPGLVATYLRGKDLTGTLYLEAQSGTSSVILVPMATWRPDTSLESGSNTDYAEFLCFIQHLIYIWSDRQILIGDLEGLSPVQSFL
jgi:hypothetical protein